MVSLNCSVSVQRLEIKILMWPASLILDLIEFCCNELFWLKSILFLLQTSYAVV